LPLQATHSMDAAERKALPAITEATDLLPGLLTMLFTGDFLFFIHSRSVFNAGSFD
jgi:hypothetical protein